MAEDLLDRLAGKLGGIDLLRRQLAQQRLLPCVGLGLDAGGVRLAQLGGQVGVDLARVAPGAGGHLGRQQRRNQAVLVGGPDRAVLAQERGAGAFFATKAQRAVEQALGEELEAHRHFIQLTTQACGDAVDQAAGNHGLAHGGITAPLRAVAVQVVDGHGQVVVRLQQAVGGDDAVAIVVRVAGEGHVEPLAQADQALHGVRRGRVHADLPVPVDGHEAEGRIDLGIHHFQVQLVVLGDGRPVAHAGTAQWVDAQAQIGAADHVEVDDICQVGDIAAHVVVALGGRRRQRLLVVHALDASQVRRQQLVGLGLDPLGHVAVGRAAVGRVVLEAAALRWVVRRGDDDAVGQALLAATVVAEDGMGHRRGRGVLVVLAQHHLHAIGGQHFQGAGGGRGGQRVGVGTDEQRAVDAFLLAIQADGLGDRQHVVFVEAQFERSAAVARGAEGHALGRHRGVGTAGVVSGQQAGDIDQHAGRSRLACQRTERHAEPRNQRMLVFERAVYWEFQRQAMAAFTPVATSRGTSVAPAVRQNARRSAPARRGLGRRGSPGLRPGSPCAPQDRDTHSRNRRRTADPGAV